MATIDPSETQNDEGWPQKVDDPTYPHEYYVDLGKNEHESNSNERLPITIRRHNPVSIDPIEHETTKRTLPSTPNVRIRTPSSKRTSRTNTFTLPTRNQPSTSIDPDDRPIKPMKDVSVYHQASSASSTTSPKPTPRKTPLKLPKIKNTPTPFESDSFQIPSTRRQNNTITPRQNFSTTPRRPIFADIYVKQPYNAPPQKRVRSRPLIVEEYVYEYDDIDNDNDDDGFLPDYEPTPATVVSYKAVSGMTTRERENYLMSKNQRFIRAQPTPIRRIIYPH